MIENSNDGTNFPHKLLLNDTQVSKFCKGFANGSSAEIKFSKTQLSKIIQSGGFLADTTGIITVLDNFVNFPFKVLELHSKE